MKFLREYREFVLEKKNPCWKGYKQVGTKNKDGREVPNCVPLASNRKANI
jgi:hypothetical protein